jgi:hypothetical protein
MKFEKVGYSKDYYTLEKKYIGSVICDKDREVYGYLGRKKEILLQDLILKKKKIKQGTELLTEIYPLCGKIIKK